MKLPEAFEEKMRLLLQEEYETYLQCFEEPRHYGLRVNTRKISAEEFLKIAPWPLTPVPWIPNGFYYDGDRVQPAKHPYYFAGLYYLQEPSAMTPASRLPVEPGDYVLDVCAAPGGKATELGAKLNGTGMLVANDISNSRARGLLKNLELLGIGNVLVTSEEPGKLVSHFTEFFDKILIDAPCSGEGMFRKEKKMIKAWEEHGPEFFSRLQRSIVVQAAAMLRPGGMLLYSTCTFDPQENERIIEYLTRQCPELEICEMEGYEGFCPGRPEFTESKRPEFEKTVRIFPHKMQGEGHFIALLRKKESWDDHAGAPGRSGTAGKRKLPEELEEFLGSLRLELDRRRLEIREERVYYMPEGMPELRGIRFLRSGLLLGELKKNRFEPGQALAMYLKKEDYGNILDFSVEDERVIRYLKGETLDVEDLVSPSEKGWYLVCVDGYPLGFGKLASQVLKNKYLPGWRWMS
ncbi:MAG: NOL1/NOP2/sun family putative RNA methylase [Ruminococcus sp.]|nr:NOL1/NOP2/sun family putative RNA methylase [Ruminococcus sp.]